MSLEINCIRTICSLDGKGHINNLTKQNVPTPHVKNKSIPGELDYKEKMKFRRRGRDDEHIKMASKLVS